MKEVTLEAKLDSIPVLTDIVEEELAQADCPPKAMIQLSVAIDEIFSNIASYAYAPGSGMATIRLELTQEPAVVLTFIDSGIAFNPLEKEDPDVTLSADERGIGGYGIFIVKNTMDDIEYVYRDNKNVLTIRKNFSA
jgi:anti-sigma regulatory factor (Ser/Thr protein kinase)